MNYTELFDKLKNNAPTVAATTAEERIKKIRSLYQAVYDIRHEISRAGTKELGFDGKFHLVPLKSEVDYVCANLEKWMEDKVVDDVPELQTNKGYIRYEPKGVVLHIATWNSPILTALSPAISMIASGNVLIIKPSEITPISADIIQKVVESSGLSNEIAVVQGDAETAQALLKLPVDHICYIGNNQVGRLVMEAAAQHFAGITLEMGGKNPVVVEADADIEAAASKIIFSKLILAGQVCLSPDYLLVHDTVKEDLLKMLVIKIQEMFNPDDSGVENSNDFAKIVNERHTLRIKDLFDDATSKGAKIFYGGTVNSDKKYVEPTIITDISDNMKIAYEEIFGPALIVYTFSKKEEALSLIKKHPKPLAFYIFSQDRNIVDFYINNTRAGTSAVNNAVIQANVPTLPFGGCNHSGTGRLGGHAGFLEFSNARSVAEDGFLPEQTRFMMYPPFPAESTMFVDILLKPEE